MRATWVFVLCAACYDEGAVAPCTVTCETASCPGDLVCGSDKVCQTPGMPACTMTMPPDKKPIEVKAPNADENDLFGRTVALSADGTWLVVGAIGEASTAAGFDGNQSDNSKPQAGAVYIFKWDGTTYALTSYLKSPDPDNGDQFGFSVAISANGNVLAVGAPGEDGSGTNLNGTPSSNGTGESGAVFIYTRTSVASPWSAPLYLKAPTAIAGGFGAGVALSVDGKFVAVGQPGNHEALRYQLNPFTGITVSAMASVNSDNVGFPVALSGNGETLFAGAALEDGPGKEFAGDPSLNTSPDSGAVFMMFANGAQHAYCKASNTDPDDKFGSSVAVNSAADVFVVGAPGEDSGAVGTDGNQGDNSVGDAGAVYVFARSAASSWRLDHYVKSSNVSMGARFGASVAITADASYMVVGAPGEANETEEVSAGAIYVFSKAPAEWQLRSRLRAPTITALDEFGSSVAISDDHLVVASGAPKTASNAGVVYVFR